MDIYKLLTAKVGQKVDFGYDGEDWIVLGTEHPLAKKIKLKISGLNPSVGVGQLIEVDSYVDDDRTKEPNKYYVIDVHSGFNGGGDDKKWQLYLDNIKKIMAMFKKSWIIELVNDCADDVHDVVIGFKA